LLRLEGRRRRGRSEVGRVWIFLAGSLEVDERERERAVSESRQGWNGKKGEKLTAKVFPGRAAESVI